MYTETKAHKLTLSSFLKITVTSFMIVAGLNQYSNQYVQGVSIKPSDFDRFIMPCYLGGSNQYYGSSPQSQSQVPQNRYGTGGNVLSGQSQQSYQTSNSNGNQWVQNGPSRGDISTGGRQFGSSMSSSGLSSYYGSDSSRSSSQSSGGFTNLGQQIPRAQTMDNFISLVSKIEAANPRLANNPDQLIKVLLGRFRMDNYYYDVFSKTPIVEQDLRYLSIIPAILNPMNLAQEPQYIMTSDSFPEQLLDQDEKCSMYFMLSHFIQKSSSMSTPLSAMQVNQLSGPMMGQRPPVLQAAGSGYPAQSANQAYGNGQRFSGPSPSFGSPITKNMNSFGQGLTNDPERNSNDPYGTNVVQPNPQLNPNQFNNLRNGPTQPGSLTRYSTPVIDGHSRSRDERLAIEYGVVTIANQDNAAVVLNRVLMGILAASTPPQTIRQLASMIFPAQALASTPRIDEEIDPLFAVTLADLWAISAIPKNGKADDFRLSGVNGRWNDSMCPTSFQLERSSSIKFTTAELLGGLDGFSLGMFRRRMISMRKNLRLSEMLRMYYSRTGFKPQFAEVGVCNRGSILNSQMDDLHRQADNYLRLYQLNLPSNDNAISDSINRMSSFKEVTRQLAGQYVPNEICQDSSFGDPFLGAAQDQCEIPKTDLVTVMDSSPEANDLFMKLVILKLAQKLGLSRQGNTLTILTNQQDSTGYSGTYSFNAIVQNSTNTAQIGCSLVFDGSKSYQGGQITEPTRLMEMFERALINIDSEYLTRMNRESYSTSSSASSSSSYSSSQFSPSNRQSTYSSTLFNQPDSLYSSNPKSTGGSKVIVWFNYNSQVRPSQMSPSGTNWNNQNYPDYSQSKFQDAKRFLRENFRGASILAVSNSRENVKQFVYDEERDIITDIPSNGMQSADYIQSTTNDQSAMIALGGSVDQVTNKIIQRMCDIPAIFQYPTCFRAPSEGAMSVGYISPGRKQYWMMSPKTFFASRSVRMAFKVEGGRLRVCFGRMARPDEEAQRSGQTQYQTITLMDRQTNNPSSNDASQYSSSSVNNYYTGLEHAICKDVSPGQEIDFLVDDPCYHKSIAECEPFYYVIKEIGNVGEVDPNYMCKDEGCKTFDQAKFTLTHSGVICSSALKFNANWILITLSVLTSIALSDDGRRFGSAFVRLAGKSHLSLVGLTIVAVSLTVQQVSAQQAGVHDFGQDRSGEKRGNFTPSEMLAVTLLIMTILAGLALTIGLCYYVSKRNARGMTKVEQEDY